MKSGRSYFIRATHDWLSDNSLTPYLLVAAGYPGVQVPPAHVLDGKIVLNIGAGAAKDLIISDETLSFSARFAGASHCLSIPLQAVMAIYCRETGEGMAFEVDASQLKEIGDGSPHGDLRQSTTSDVPARKGPPDLRVVR